MDIKQGVWLSAVLGLIMVILIGILIFVPRSFDKGQNPLTGTDGITIYSLRANVVVSSPLKIAGIIKGNGWSGFEGQVGTVKLLDGRYLEGMGKEMASGFLAAATEWTKLPTGFETTLNFQTSGAKNGVLVFYNENPSGDPSRSKTFSLPVTFK